MPVDPVRDAAIDVLLRVLEKRVFLDRSLDKTLRRKGSALSSRGRRFLTQLVYGTVRHKLLADSVLSGPLHQPLGELPAPIRTILRMGVFQALFCNQVTFPAMVHTSVDLAKSRGHIGTSRLVNAVLKRVPETLEDVTLPDPTAEPIAYESLRYSIPSWLVEHWHAQFGQEQASRISASCGTEAPRTIRTNTLVTDADKLLQALTKPGSAATRHPVINEAITLVEGPIPYESKAFQNGHFYIQDPASMLPPHLLEPQPGETILDMCAAPGGKATHIAQLTANESRVLALDSQRQRLYPLCENIERLHVEGIQPILADSTIPPLQGPFDRILVDAPCSGLGTLRRHPDLKWRVSPENLKSLPRLQGKLLRSAIQLCKNGGVIVYSVCTFTGEETDDVINEILPDAPVQFEDGPEWLSPWKIGKGKYLVLPEEGQMDGYFLTRLRKAY